MVAISTQIPIYFRIGSIIALLWLVVGCSAPEEKTEVQDTSSAPQEYLRILGSERTGITMVNQMVEDTLVNYFRWMNLYHSGGVAIGDLTGDGAPEVMIVTNRQGGQLFKNLGGLKFERMDVGSGIDLNGLWCTGVSMADLNMDGLLDIYVCVSGPERYSTDRRDRAFVNQGNGKFIEQGRELGLGSVGTSQQAFFADMDQDNDLDLYLTAHRTDWANASKVITDSRFVPYEHETDRLFINENGHYIDRTKAAGLMNKGWSLGGAIGDMNEDGLPDVYVSNDFTDRDFLYINNGDGTFTDRILDMMGHICFFSMGTDRADINNDGLPDIYVVDMTPSDHKLSKENMASMRPDQFYRMVAHDMHHQYMANALQLNKGNGHYAEVAQLAGIDRTDWSWAPLIFDVDNDGLKDIFVSNGIQRDVANSDFRENMRKLLAEKGMPKDPMELLASCPSHVPDNLMFKNNDGLSFTSGNEAWNYHHSSITTGAAYADLDSDGDLDMITLDANAPAKVIENLSADRGDNGYLQVELEGGSENRLGIGSKAYLYGNGGLQLVELYTSRGFQSSVEPLIHFGVGTSTPDSLVVEWYNGARSTLANPGVNKRLRLSLADATGKVHREKPEPMMKDIAADIGLAIAQRQVPFDDMKTEILMPHIQSEHGPNAAVADVNGDGLDDLLFTNSAGTAPSLLLQNGQGRFIAAAIQPWSRFKSSEFLGAHFFDGDGDGDQDLYLAAGSTEFGASSKLYQDRYFENSGTGTFTYLDQAVPAISTPTQSIASLDLDNDNDLDLFIGGRNVPGAYPSSPKSFILINDAGRFTDGSKQWLAGNQELGMINDTQVNDMDGDGLPDLVMAGEWTPIRVLRSTGQSLEDQSASYFDQRYVGLWFKLQLADMDGDGDQDLIAGNLGLNNKFHPSLKKPLKIYMADMDGSNTNDIVLAKCSEDKELPVRGRQCSSEQMPFIEQKFPTYKQFASADLRQIYGSVLDSALQLSITEMGSMVWWNEGGTYTPELLPNMAQTGPVRGIAVMDVNDDGHNDMLVAGNMYGTEVETSRYDGGSGTLLLGGKDRKFTAVPNSTTGIYTTGDVRGILPLAVAGKRCYLVTQNNGVQQVFAAR